MINQIRVLCVLTMVLAAAVFVPARAVAQEPAGAKDHPMVPRMPSYQIADFSFEEFEAAEFPLPNDKTKTIEGKHWKILYALKDGAKKSSELEILRTDGGRAQNRRVELVKK